MVKRNLKFERVTGYLNKFSCLDQLHSHKKYYDKVWRFGEDPWILETGIHTGSVKLLKKKASVKITEDTQTNMYVHPFNKYSWSTY